MMVIPVVGVQVKGLVIPPVPYDVTGSLSVNGKVAGVVAQGLAVVVPEGEVLSVPRRKRNCPVILARA